MGMVKVVFTTASMVLASVVVFFVEKEHNTFSNMASQFMQEYPIQISITKNSNNETTILRRSSYNNETSNNETITLKTSKDQTTIPPTTSIDKPTVLPTSHTLNNIPNPYSSGTITIEPSLQKALQPADQPCTPHSRRALAAKGDDATEEEWKTMTECTLYQDMHNKIGHYFHHISKSGGTSMDALFNRNKKLQQQHCNAARPKELWFETYWYRYKTLKAHGTSLPGFGITSRRRTYGITCDKMMNHMKLHRMTVIINEGVMVFDSNTVPEGVDWTELGVRGGCPNTVNSITFREPMARLVSHYRHVLDMGGKEHNKENYVDANTGKFNVAFMKEAFDMISDNYYTRHLVGHGFHSWEHTDEIPSLAEHPDAWTRVFPIANASLHNMDWVILMGSERPNEEEERELILKYGLGLQDSQFARKRVASSAGTNSTKNSIEDKLSDPETARKLNIMDLLLWEEALRLNQLDIVSVQRMQPYFQEALEKARDGYFDSSRCCGRACSQ